ncbi:MAG: pyridoxal phosphate-dependent aminotransferase, partial [Campylobacter sp.]|nr:pyridoxal phosphate-dependent aminotransferase [Campylobacter sp.]
KLKKENELEYKISQIITNVGGKHALFEALNALVEDGDEVLIPAPYWVSYPEIVKFCGGTPIFMQSGEDFKITAQTLKNSITPKTKVLILSSPCNPTGAVYTRAELEELAEVLKDTSIIVLSDEIYEKLTYEGEFISLASISKDMFDRTVTINSLSKCGAMPGWRFGYMASNMADFNKAVRALQSQSTSNICTLVQAGAVPVLLGKTDDDIAFMRDDFKKRRDISCELLSKIDGFKFSKPAGAFYIFINCSAIEKDSMKFCKRMLEEAKVATVPGIGFGMDGYFRFSYTTDEESIKKGIERIANFVKNYR